MQSVESDKVLCSSATLITVQVLILADELNTVPGCRAKSLLSELLTSDSALAFNSN